MATYRFQSSACGRVPRRTFLADIGMGFTGLALGAMLQRDGLRERWRRLVAAERLPAFAPKAKSVIWLFMIGGVSHLESFDPKPALNKYAGISISETPFKNVLDAKFLDEKHSHRRTRPAEDPFEALSTAGGVQQARRKRHRG